MITRRDAIIAGSALAAATAARPLAAVGRPRVAADLIVRGGTVFDGTGAEGIEADVAIVGNRITQVARNIRDTARTEIDARGLAVAPGFIDIHSHGTGSLLRDPRLESVVRQGITTIVAGQDGSSYGIRRGPTGAASVDDVQLPEFFDSVNRAQPSVNVAMMIGLGTLRGAVIGDADRRATPGEIALMTAMVERALAQGACGASTGLEYPPGAFADTAELTALCKPLASRGLCYATHMRNEDDQLLDSIRESIAVAQGAGCRLQISHLKTQGPRNWNKLDAAFDLMMAAKRGGLDVAFDRYPYIAYQTGLSNLFPLWSQDGGTAAFLKRLTDSTTADRVRRETLGKVELIGGWDNVQIAGVSDPTDRDAEGKRLGTLAVARNMDAYAYAVGMLQRNGGSVGMVGFAMSEANLDRILAHPLGMVCSDGSAFAIEGPTRSGSPHPRGSGTYPRVLARYVRERKALTLAQAIYKMTAFPASRLGLRDRGTIAAEKAADIVVFDPAKVEDRSTFDQPFAYPVGIHSVIVNGTFALREGSRAQVGTGRAL